MSEQKIDWKARERGAIWKSDKGNLNIKLEFNGKVTQLVAFPNKFKEENPSAPDFRVYISEQPGQTTAKPTAAKPKSAPVASNVVKNNKPPVFDKNKVAAKPVEEVPEPNQDASTTPQDDGIDF